MGLWPASTRCASGLGSEVLGRTFKATMKPIYLQGWHHAEGTVFNDQEDVWIVDLLFYGPGGSARAFTVNIRRIDHPSKSEMEACLNGPVRTCIETELATPRQGTVHTHPDWVVLVC